MAVFTDYLDFSFGTQQSPDIILYDVYIQMLGRHTPSAHITPMFISPSPLFHDSLRSKPMALFLRHNMICTMLPHCSNYSGPYLLHSSQIASDRVELPNSVHCAAALAAQGSACHTCLLGKVEWRQVQTACEQQVGSAKIKMSHAHCLQAVAASHYFEI